MHLFHLRDEDGTLFQHIMFSIGDFQGRVDMVERAGEPCQQADDQQGECQGQIRIFVLLVLHPFLSFRQEGDLDGRFVQCELGESEEHGQIGMEQRVLLRHHVSRNAEHLDGGLRLDRAKHVDELRDVFAFACGPDVWQRSSGDFRGKRLPPA